MRGSHHYARSAFLLSLIQRRERLRMAWRVWAGVSAFGAFLVGACPSVEGATFGLALAVGAGLAAWGSWMDGPWRGTAWKMRRGWPQA